MPKLHKTPLGDPNPKLWIFPRSYLKSKLVYFPKQVSFNLQSQQSCFFLEAVNEGGSETQRQLIRVQQLKLLFLVEPRKTEDV